MCIKSNPFKGAKGTAWGNFALGAGQAILGHSEKGREIDAINRARLLKFETKRRDYHLDYRDRVLAWKNQNLDDSIALDQGYKKALGNLADNQLKVWNSVKQGTIAEQEAYAAMMSVGGGEQTGARSKSSTSRREQVIKFGHRMNQIAIAKSSSRDNAALYASRVRDAFTSAAHMADIKSGTSRPVYGAAPVFEGYKAKPSKWNMLLGIGKSALESKMLFDKLKGPDSSAGGSVFGPEYDLDPDIGKDLPPWPEMEPGWEPTFDVERPVFGDDAPIPDKIPEMPGGTWDFPQTTTTTKAQGERLLGKQYQAIHLKGID